MIASGGAGELEPPRRGAARGRRRRARRLDLPLRDLLDRRGQGAPRRGRAARAGDGAVIAPAPPQQVPARATALAAAPRPPDRARLQAPGRRARRAARPVRRRWSPATGCSCSSPSRPPTGRRRGPRRVAARRRRGRRQPRRPLFAAAAVHQAAGRRAQPAAHVVPARRRARSTRASTCASPTASRSTLLRRRARARAARRSSVGSGGPALRGVGFTAVKGVRARISARGRGRAAGTLSFFDGTFPFRARRRSRSRCACRAAAACCSASGSLKVTAAPGQARLPGRHRPAGRARSGVRFALRGVVRASRPCPVSATLRATLRRRRRRRRGARQRRALLAQLFFGISANRLE